MNWVQVLFVIPFIVQMNCTELPDILWDPRNLIFNSKKCGAGSKTIYAKINDQLNILCANPNINIGLDGTSLHKSLFNYNVYYTDIELVYKSRNGRAATLLHFCKVYESAIDGGQMYSPLAYKKQISLSRYSFGTLKSFQDGKRYWFFTTSNGTEASLFNKVGNKTSMSFELNICPDAFVCKQRWRKEACLPIIDKELEDLQSPGMMSPILLARDHDNSPVKSSKHESNTSSTSTSKNTILIASVTLALILGVLMGVLLMILKKKFCSGKGLWRKNESDITDINKNTQKWTLDRKGSIVAV